MRDSGEMGERAKGHTDIIAIKAFFPQSLQSRVRLGQFQSLGVMDTRHLMDSQTLGEGARVFFRVLIKGPSIW